MADFRSQAFTTMLWLTHTQLQTLALPTNSTSENLCTTRLNLPLCLRIGSTMVLPPPVSMDPEIWPLGPSKTSSTKATSMSLSGSNMPTLACLPCSTKNTRTSLPLKIPSAILSSWTACRIPTIHGPSMMKHSRAISRLSPISKTS